MYYKVELETGLYDKVVTLEEVFSFLRRHGKTGMKVKVLFNNGIDPIIVTDQIVALYKKISL